MKKRAQGILRTIVLVMAVSSCGFMEESPTLFEIQQWKASGDYRKALVALKGALQKEPDDLETRRVLVEVYIAMGRGDLAEQHLRYMEEHDPQKWDLRLMAEARLLQGDTRWVLEEVQPGRDGIDSVSARILRGNAYLAQGDIEAAINEYKPAEHTVAGQIGMVRAGLLIKDLNEVEERLSILGAPNPSEPELSFLWGRLFFETGQYSKAEEAFSKSAVGFGGGATKAGEESLLWVARSELLLGRTAAATATVDNLLRAGAHPRVQVARAALAFELRDYQTAEKHLLKVLKSFPTQQQALLMMGTVQFLRGKQEQAALYLSRLLSANPDNADARRMLANVELRRQQPEKAKEILAPLMVETQNDPQLLGMFAETLIRTGEHTLGIDYYRRAVSEAPKNHHLRVRLAGASLIAGEAAEAKRILEALEEENPLSQQDQLLLALALLYNGDVDSARRQIDALLEAKPDNSALHNAAGVIYAKVGEEAAARAHFEKAIEIDSDYYYALMNIGLLELQDGNRKKASVYYRKALEVRSVIEQSRRYESERVDTLSASGLSMELD